MIQIHFTENSFEINDAPVTLPISIDALQSLIGVADEIFKGKDNTMYLWSESDIRAYSKDAKQVYGLELTYRIRNNKHFPKQAFSGKILLNGVDIKEYYKHNKSKLVKMFKGDDDGAFIFHNHSISVNIVYDEWDCITIEAWKKQTVPVIEMNTPEKEFEHLIPLWTNWISAIQMFVDEDNEYYNLTHGISQEQQQKTQSLFDSNLPQVLVNFYKIYNIIWDSTASTFSFSVHGRTYNLLPFEKIHQEWEAITGLCEEDEELEEELREGFSDKIKTDDYTNPKWIPFAAGYNGDYLLIDPDPSEKGSFGQIIELLNEEWQRQVISTSLEELIKTETEHIKKNGKEKFEWIIENGI